MVISLLITAGVLVPLVGLILTIIAATLLVIVVALLLVPFDISGHLARADSRTSTRFSVTWLYGAIGFARATEDEETKTSIMLFGRTVRTSREEEKEEREEEEKEEIEEGGKLRFDSVLEILSELPNLYDPIRRLLDALLNSLRLRRASAAVRVGLMDPSQTGMLIGGVYAFMGVLSPWRDVLDIRVDPVFDEPLLEGRVSVDLRIRLLRLVYPAIRLFLNRSARKMMRIAG